MKPVAVPFYAFFAVRVESHELLVALVGSVIILVPLSPQTIHATHTDMLQVVVPVRYIYPGGGPPARAARTHAAGMRIDHATLAQPSKWYMLYIMDEPIHASAPHLSSAIRETAANR